MHIHKLSETDSVLNSFLLELRSVAVQNDRMRFRRNVERIGEILCYEMSKSFLFNTEIIMTPLGEKSIKIPENNIVICSILRAGIPFHNGVLNYFDNAESAFISAYRKHSKVSSGFEIKVEYIACPDLSNKTLVLVDPMLATGQSLVLTYEALQQFGAPKNVQILSVIGAEEGVNYAATKLPDEAHLWIADIDPVLNDKGYIIPGLGDAGDLCYGKKLQQ